MQRRKSFIPVILVCILISALLFLLFRTNTNNFITNTITTLFSPTQKFLFTFVSPVHRPQTSADVKKLQEENLSLVKKLIDQTKLQEDNNALRDQFATAAIPSQHLLPARIIGEPGFVPGISLPDGYVIDKGSDDNVQIGMSVVYKNMLIGQVTNVYASSAYVSLITAKSSSFTAATLDKKVLGIIGGQGNGEIILSNVLLSQHLAINNIIVTNGDVNTRKTSGYPPGLIVGKITAIQKDPSALFQQANVTPFLPFTQLSIVFILLNP